MNYDKFLRELKGIIYGRCKYVYINVYFLNINKILVFKIFKDKLCSFVFY